MKNKKQLTQIEARSLNTELPKYNHNFQRLKEELREAVNSNFGYSVANSLEYDSDTQLFWVTIDKTGPLKSSKGSHPTCLEVRRHASIDTKQPLLEQFEQVQSVIDEVTEIYNSLYHFYEIKNARN